MATNTGLPLGPNGFANFTLEYGQSEPTDRSVQRDDAALLVAGLLCFAMYIGTGQTRWRQIGIRIVKWTVIAGIGIYVSSALLIGYFMRRHGRYGWPASVAVSVAVPLVFYLVFTRISEIGIGKLTARLSHGQATAGGVEEAVMDNFHSISRQPSPSF